MESSQVRRVLIVANRTAATPTLLDHVKQLVRERPTTFSLLIPDAPKRRAAPASAWQGQRSDSRGNCA